MNTDDMLKNKTIMFDADVCLLNLFTFLVTHNAV